MGFNRSLLLGIDMSAPSGPAGSSMLVHLDVPCPLSLLLLLAEVFKFTVKQVRTF